jgi:hypothetical protein
VQALPAAAGDQAQGLVRVLLRVPQGQGRAEQVAQQVGGRMTVSPEIAQLQQQQVYLTRSLQAMLEGTWCGAPPSTEAFVLALDPGLQVSCKPPILASDAPPAPPNYLANYNPNEYMPPQAASWSCSACSLAWVERALGLNPNANEQSAINEIGYPDNINGTYGLMDGSGAQLQRVLSNYGQKTSQAWLSYDSAWSIYSQTPGCMSGGAWYHWVACRGTSDGNLWIANSAPGYMGVWDILTRADFNRLGPFSCVWTTP